MTGLFFTEQKESTCQECVVMLGVPQTITQYVIKILKMTILKHHEHLSASETSKIH